MNQFRISLQSYLFSLLLVFGFCFCNITVWLYASNPTFFDGIPYIFLGGLLCSSILIGSILYGLMMCIIQIPLIQSILHPRKNLISRLLVIISLIWLITPICICVVSWQSSEKKLESPPKLLIIGLDAATWDLMNPWIEEGILPNLKRIRDEGVSSTLKSMDPMRSPSLWTTIATGVSPDQHGVSGFFSSRSDLKTARIWDVMQSNGIDVGLFGWLLTSPPEPKFAFCIPAWLARDAETHPLSKHFIQEMNLDQALGGGQLNQWNALFQAATQGSKIRSIETIAQFYIMDWFGLDDEARLAKKMRSEISMQTDLFIHLLNEYQPGVSTFTFYGSDKLGHRFWHYMQPDAFADHEYEPKPNYQHVIRNYYQTADAAIGRMLELVDESTTIVVLSDHGMKADPAMPRQYFLDTQELLKLIKVEELFRHHTIMRQTFLEPAFEDALLVEETKSALQAMRFADGEAVFRVMIENGRIVIRTNFSLTYNPDSPLILNETIQYAEQSIPVNHLFFLRTFSGAHDSNGILMMKGPQLKRGVTIGETQLVDIAPTLLHLTEQSVSREIEGAVIEDAFEPEWLNENPILFVDQYEDVLYDTPPQESNGALLERLRSMGYVE